MEVGTHAAGLFFAALALIGWTALSFFIRLALRDAPFLRGTATVTTTNGVLVTLAAAAYLPWASVVPSLWRTVFLLLAVGLFMIVLSRLTYYFAIRHIGPSRTLPVATSTPAVTALLAALWLDEPLSLRMFLGLGLLIGGITAVVRAEPARPAGGAGYTPRQRALGWLSAGATTFLWSLSSVIIKVIVADIPPLGAMMLAIWIGVPVAWMVALGFESERAPREIPRGNWRWIFCAALCQTLAVPSYAAALARTYAVNVSSVTAMQPLFAILIAHLFVREAENVTPRLILGGSLTVGGTLMVLV